MSKIANTKAHLKTTGIMIVLLGFMGSVLTWPLLTLKVFATGAAVVLLALIYTVIYSIIKTRDLDNRDRDNYGDYR
jgi:tetrahydromethanopterin S-methyltransferase subunit E